MKIYMMVTKDKYEWPLAMAESMGQLGEKVGVSKQTICSTIRRTRMGAKRPQRFVEVEIGDDDDV